MAIYVQYFHETTYVEGSIPPNFDGPPRLVESCGDRAIIRVDARLNMESIHRIAADYGMKNRDRYKAWQITKGEALRDAKPPWTCRNDLTPNRKPAT